jgi:hypothetical protein
VSNRVRRSYPQGEKKYRYDVSKGGATNMKKALLTTVVVSGLLFSAAGARGGELFVAPGDTIPVRLRQGNFLAAATLDTSFTFALPGDVIRFTSATVVLLPTQSGTFN